LQKQSIALRPQTYESNTVQNSNPSNKNTGRKFVSNQKIFFSKNLNGGFFNKKEAA
jgi:hypothetical protein